MLNHASQINWYGNWNNQYLMHYQEPPASGSNAHESYISQVDKDGALLVFPNSSACSNGIGYGACGISSLKNDNFSKYISVYPNPMSTKLKIINNTNFTIDGIELFTHFGTLALKQKAPISEINLESYPSGMYFIRLFVKDNILTYKAIKQ
jgi:hypothetical protein